MVTDLAFSFKGLAFSTNSFSTCPLIRKKKCARVYIYIYMWGRYIGAVENQMDQTMENDMETAIYFDVFEPPTHVLVEVQKSF